jgi:hypothetical protein
VLNFVESCNIQGVRKVGRAVECTGLVKTSADSETRRMIGVKFGETPGAIPRQRRAKPGHGHERVET